ncbi:MAG TPA: lipocalin family protein [Lacibacter sp.]|nr:lipocalin family protein [Lacibacter sp.]
MIKLQLKTLCIVLLIFTAFTACKKKNDVKSKTELLTKAAWVTFKYEEKAGNSAYVDDFPNWSACEKDNKITFGTNNVATFDEGATKCNPSDPQTETATWSLSDNDTKLILDGETLTIEQLDENTLVVVSTFVFLGETYTTRISLRH